MCGRFNVETHPLSRLLMAMIGQAHPGPDNHNTAPTETVVVLRHGSEGTPELAPMRWWLTPYWAKAPDTRYSLFNARAETAFDKPALREPMRRRRCVVPVSGFYEWARAPAASALGKLPYYIHPCADADPGMLLAGAWDRFQPHDGGPALESFAILTTAAHPAMRFVHDRQPVMLTPAECARWLDPETDVEALRPLLAPRLPLPLLADPVSSYVNNARHKEARCTEPVADAVRLAADGSPA